MWNSQELHQIQVKLNKNFHTFLNCVFGSKKFISMAQPKSIKRNDGTGESIFGLKKIQIIKLIPLKIIIFIKLNDVDSQLTFLSIGNYPV